MSRFRNFSAGVALSLSLSFGLIDSGCQPSREELQPPQDALPTAGTPGGSAGTRLDEGRYFEEPVLAKNLTVWPIYTDRQPVVGEFLTLKEAEDKGLASVSEMGAGGLPANSAPRSSASTTQSLVEEQTQTAGSSAAVNTLMIENKGSIPILVCGGTVVKGGNQDRQIAQDFVIAPGTRVPVDAFCIEHGRWQEDREGAPTMGLFKSREEVAPTPIRFSAQYSKDQQAVWMNVAQTNSAAGKDPGTGTLLATLEESDPAVVSRRREMEGAVGSRFQALRAKGRSIVGFAYAVNGKPVTVRTFGHPRLLEKQFDAFLKSMCLEADLSGAGAGGNPGAAAPPARLQDVLDLVAAINKEKEGIEGTRAANHNGIRLNGSGGNFNCYLRMPGENGAQPSTETFLVPISQDWTSAAEVKR